MKVLIAGGGTGGHLFPGIAIAEAFRTREPETEILFVGTGKPIEVSTLSKKGFDHVDIIAEGFKGKGLLSQIRSLIKMPVGLWQALRIIRRFDPDIIIGVGGYSSGPVALAGRPMGKKIVIHEQNIEPGLTNKILGLFADRIFISFPDNQAIFEPSRTIISGNPVRRGLVEHKPIDKKTGLFTVLVLGGSQGSHAINRAVVEALDHLKTSAQMAFIHQTGEKDASWVARAYESRGIKAKVESFFTDMAEPYGSADLVICRAGATTVSELMALGKPAIFIPFPFAANNHQELNARYVAEAGGAEIVLEKDLNGGLLAEKLDNYLLHPKILQSMGKRASVLSRPNAADVVVDECHRLVESGL